jgi:gas vesicle protein
MNNNKKIMIAIAAGAILGILFAPAKGSDIRGKINKKGKKMKAFLDSFSNCKESCRCKEKAMESMGEPVRDI